MPGHLHDIDWLADQCESRSASSIARELGVATETVLRAMRLHKIPVRFATSERRPLRPELDDADWLADRYAGTAVGVIAKELGVAESTVTRALEGHGIEIRDTSETQRLRMPAELYDTDWLREHYASKSGAQIAAELGVSFSTVHKAFARAGVDTDGPWVRRDTVRLKRPTDQQLKRAWVSNRTIKSVANEFGVSPGKAAVWLAEVGIFLHEVPAISKSDLLDAIAAGRSIGEIAADLRVADRTVMVELRRHGLVDQHRHRPRVIS